MLVSTQITLALRCPVCGKLDFFTLSRFSFSKSRNRKISCECGIPLVIFDIINGGRIGLQIECNMCETRHLVYYKAFEFWSGQILKISCKNTGLDIGYIGARELVEEAVKKANRSIREMAEELGYDKYFLNPEIMYKVLDLIRRMTEEGRVSCSCGGDRLEVEVFPDRVELNCFSCKAVGIVFAETVKDLQWVHNMEEIFLEAHTYRYLDDKRFRKRGLSRKRHTSDR